MEQGQYKVRIRVTFLGGADSLIGGVDSAEGFIGVTDRTGFLQTVRLEKYPAAIGDFTGDDTLDFLGPPEALAGGERGLFLYAGYGNGRFSKRLAWKISLPLVLADGDVVADFTGDGQLDLVPFGPHGGWIRHDLFVLVNQGDGTFKRAPAWSFGEGADIYKVRAGDLDGDGYADLAVLFSWGDREVLSILWGSGDGRFTDSIELLNRSIAENEDAYPLVGMAIADFNGDGIDDLAVGENNVKAFGTIVVWEGIWVFLGREDRSFSKRGPLELLPPRAATRLLGADLNGDNRADLVLGEPGTSGQAPSLRILSSAGRGQFRDWLDYRLNGFLSIYNLGMGDFDGDKRRDMLVSGGPLAILFNDGDCFTSLLFSNARQAQIGDLNGDGYVDLIIPTEIMLNSGPG